MSSATAGERPSNREQLIDLMLSVYHDADGIRTARDLMANVLCALESADVCLVPKDPTDAMCDAAWESEATGWIGEHKVIESASESYVAMLAASPYRP